MHEGKANEMYPSSQSTACIMNYLKYGQFLWEEGVFHMAISAACWYQLWSPESGTACHVHVLQVNQTAILRY